MNRNLLFFVIAALGFTLIADWAWADSGRFGRLSESRKEGSEAEARKPNIVLILADDLGYGDLGSYGQLKIKTPSLDKMAKQGMRFTDFYSGSTVCAPSRCVLMTGYHTGRCYIRGNGKENLRKSDLTIAELLKSAGYRTCLAGKWGLGGEGSVGYPTKKGFDSFFGYADQSHAHNYYPSFLNTNDGRKKLANVVPKMGKYGQGVASVKKQYSHDLITDFAFDFVKKNHDHTFFLYWSLTIPHANNEAGKKGMEVPDFGIYAYRDWPEPQKGHAAMISRMDRDIGRLVDLLKELKIDDNTLIIFTSDNGPHREGGNNPDFANSNGPLSGIKRSLAEGGIRVPMIAYWPKQIEAGSVSDWIGGFQDFMPTFAQIAGATQGLPKDLDGLSMLDVFQGAEGKKSVDKNRVMYWAFYERGGGRAIRSGNWKLVQQPIHSQPRLYDLSQDIGETRNLADAKAKIRDGLIEEMERNDIPSLRWKFPSKKPGRRKQTKGGRENP